MMTQSPEQKKSGLHPLRVVASVLAAAFGVRGGKNRERDFREGKLINFLIAGIILTAAFVVGIYLVVTTVLENAN